MRPFHFINVTWGSRHTQLFLEVSLPTQLSPGNLPAFSNREGTIYKIYTTYEDAQRIRQSPTYEQLCQTVTTEIILIEVNPETPHHLMFAEFHKLAISAAEEVEAALVFLAPDTLLSDGSFAHLGELVDAGKRAVFTVGIRLTMETFVPAFHKRYRPDRETHVTMSGRDLVELALDHIHPICQGMIWPASIPCPSNLFWSVGREGLIGRCFHLHPIVIVASPSTASFSSTIDGDYLELACPRGTDSHVICDSDEFCIFEISPKKYMLGLAPSDPMDHRGVARWALHSANRVHRQLVKSSIRIHRGNLSSAWDNVQAKSDDDVRKVLILLRFYAACFFLGGGSIVYKFLRKVLRPYKTLIMQARSLPVRVVRRSAKAVLGLFVDDPRQFVADCRHETLIWRGRFKRLLTQPRQTLSNLALKIQGRSNKLPQLAGTEPAGKETGSARLGNRASLEEISTTHRLDSEQAPSPTKDMRVAAVRK